MEDIQQRMKDLVLTGRGSRDETFTALYKAYAKRISSFIEIRLGHNSSQRDDLTQIVFLKLYTHMLRYNPLYSINTWIFSITQNTIIDYVRAQAGKAVENTDCSDIIETFISPEKGPAEKLIELELSQRIDSCIGQMTAADRQIAYLRFYEGMKIREIGRVLHVPSGTVKYRIFSIRAKLKRMMEAEDEN